MTEKLINAMQINNLRIEKTYKENNIERVKYSKPVCINSDEGQIEVDTGFIDIPVDYDNLIEEKFGGKNKAYKTLAGELMILNCNPKRERAKKELIANKKKAIKAKLLSKKAEFTPEQWAILEETGSV